MIRDPTAPVDPDRSPDADAADGGVTEAALPDGSTVSLRAAMPADEAAVRAFLGDLGDEVRRRLGDMPGQGDLADWEAGPDGGDHRAILAVHGPAHRVIGLSAWTRTAPDGARLDLVVADDYVERGVACLLLGRLAETAEQAGITTLGADLTPDDLPTVAAVNECGLPVRISSEPGRVRVEVSTSPTPEARHRFERRDELAAAAAVRSMMQPASIAVIGASRQRQSIGGQLFHNLLHGDFAGPVYPVNPGAGAVQGVRSYASVLDIPDPVELAMIVVPAPAVVGVARECAEKGVKGLVVMSAGFAEVGKDGAALQADLLAVCREGGIRLIGPNCMGIANTAADIRMNGQFAPIAPLSGNVGFLTQSGGLGLALIDHANRLGLGLSTFVSVGNKADLSGNDFLCYWEDDPATRVILLYLESLGNPRRFARIARRVARSKPIVAVKSGRSSAGARATSSHTGALIAASDVTVDALFHQAGVIRLDMMAELFGVASLLANQPVPTGKRVAILTNSGGPGILSADACEAAGLEVPELSEEVRARLGEWLPTTAGVGNPVDMIASATAADYGRAIEEIATDPGIDAIIVIFAPPLATRAEDVGTAIRTAAGALDRPIPVVAVFMAAVAPPAELRDGDGGVPAFTYPEDAARAIAQAARYGQWRAEPDGAIPELPGVREAEASAAVAAMLAAGPSRWLDPDDVRTLLSCYGLPVVEERQAESPREAAEAAAAIGLPVALKGTAPGVLHKTDLGGVRLGLESTTEVETAAREITGALAASGHHAVRFLVQPMVRTGVEMLVGVVHDRTFGPVIACAAGGTEAELLKDVSVRITPLTDLDARGMVRSLGTFPLLDGFRGRPRADIGALEDVLLRVSAMVEAHPEVVEMDLNPVVVHEEGAVIVDARIRIEGL